MLSCLFSVLCRVLVVAASGMGVMRRLLVVTGNVVFAGFEMVLGGVLVVLGCFSVMFGCFCTHCGDWYLLPAEPGFGGHSGDDSSLR